MATVAIVAHSRAGNTWRLAETVCDGARIADAQVHLIRIDEEGIVDEAGWDMLAVADGIIFGCPTHMGGPSWQFKRFADTTIRAWRPTVWRDKLAGGFTNSTGMSGDKFSTLTYFWTLAMQQGMVWIGSGMKPAIAYDKAAPRESLNYIGGYGGAMATNPFDDPRTCHRPTWPPQRRSGSASPPSWPPEKPRTPPTSTSLKTNASNHLRLSAPA